MPNGDLPFADVSRESLAKLSNREVLQVHKRFDQSWRKREIMTVPLEGLSREDFLGRFTSLVAELKRRELDRPDAEALDAALARQNPRQETDQPPLSEAFHLRDTHWVDVPESGACPVSHPTKARFPGKQKQVCFTKSAAESAAQARMREQDEPEQVEPEQVEPKQDDKPRSSRGLTVAETFAAIQEKGQKFTQDEANFQRVAPSPDKVCGACRFYLRSPTEAIGACQVVDGPIPWFATSDLYISATDEAVASFAAAQQIARATSPFNESDLFYGDADLTRASTDDEKADSGAREAQVEKGE